MITNIKSKRQEMILMLVRDKSINTQEVLTHELKKLGFHVDQSTLSRDVKELGLIKTQHNGSYKYSVIQEALPVPRISSKIILSRFVKNVDYSGNIIIFKTPPGDAHAVGEAVDRMQIAGILGTVAGDNTLMAVVKKGYSTKSVFEKITKEMQR